MFNIVRILIGFILLFVLIKIRKKIIFGHRWFICSVMAILIISSLLLFIPFENLFLTFDTPQKAYEYMNFKNSDIKLVVNGENSDFIVGNNGNSDAYLILPKTTNGWKLATGINTKRVFQGIYDGVIVYVYRYKYTNDFYITVLDTNSSKVKIEDLFKSQFYALDNANDNGYTTYYAHIPEFNENYWIEVNGNVIKKTPD
ncbi:MAG: hypothetical protein IKV52_05340 [Oscillospiraceae bacterium]|nr:hypothetical protein [Oscillospiraceae bacterium]